MPLKNYFIPNIQNLNYDKIFRNYGNRKWNINEYVNYTILEHIEFKRNIIKVNVFYHFK